MRRLALLVLSLSLWASSAHAAITFVSRVQGTAAAGIAATVGTNDAAGDLLIVCAHAQNATVTGIMDTAGNTFHGPYTTGSQSSNKFEIWYAYNILGNAANVVTVTWTVPTSYQYAVAYNFSGFTTTDPADVHASASGLGTAISSGTLTITGTSDVIVAMGESDGGSTSAGTGYTLASSDGTYLFDEYHIVSASEAATATGVSNNWGITAAAFQIGSGGGGGCTQVPSFTLLGVGGCKG